MDTIKKINNYLNEKMDMKELKSIQKDFMKEFKGVTVGIDSKGRKGLGLLVMTNDKKLLLKLPTEYKGVPVHKRFRGEIVTEARKMSPKVKKDLVGTALQIVFEYPSWGDEHIGDMYDTIDRPKFEYEDLEDITIAADKLKKKGFGWGEAEDFLMKQKGTPNEIWRKVHKATR